MEEDLARYNWHSLLSNLEPQEGFEFFYQLYKHSVDSDLLVTGQSSREANDKEWINDDLKLQIKQRKNLLISEV